MSCLQQCNICSEWKRSAMVCSIHFHFLICFSLHHAATTHKHMQFSSFLQQPTHTINNLLQKIFCCCYFSSVCLWRMKSQEIRVRLILTKWKKRKKVLTNEREKKRRYTESDLVLFMIRNLFFYFVRVPAKHESITRSATLPTHSDVSVWIKRIRRCYCGIRLGFDQRRSIEVAVYLRKRQDQQ